MGQELEKGRERLLWIAAQTLNRLAAWRERAHKGGALLEYALVLAFVAVAVMGALHVLQPRISSTLDMIARSF